MEYNPYCIHPNQFYTDTWGNLVDGTPYYVHPNQIVTDTWGNIIGQPNIPTNSDLKPENKES